MNAKDLILKLLVVDKMSPGLKKAGQEAEKTETKTEKLQKTTKSLQMTWVAAAAAAASIAAVMRKLITAYGQQELAERKLAGALKATGQYTEEAMKSMTDFASEIQKTTVYGDEAVLSYTQMAISMGLTADQAKEAVRGAIGLSNALGIELRGALRGVTLAMQGEYTLLNRYIPALRSANTEAEKQAILQKTLADTFAVARDEINTYAGQAAQNANLLGDAYEKMGELVLEVFGPALKDTNSALVSTNKILERSIGLLRTFRQRLDESSAAAKLIFQAIKNAYDVTNLFSIALRSNAALLNIIGNSITTSGNSISELISLTRQQVSEFTKIGATHRDIITPSYQEELDIQSEINRLLQERGEMLISQSPLDEFFQTQQENLTIMEERYRAVADTFTGAFEGAFAQWIKGSKSLGEALKDSLLNALADVMAKYLASKLFGLLLGVVGGPGGFLVQGLGSLATSAAPSFSMATGGQPGITIQNYQASPFATSSDEMAKELIYSLERRMDLQGRFNR